MSPKSPARWPLADVVTRLAKHHGAQAAPASRDPFELVLWDNCAYLVDDVRRAKVFARLKRATRNDPIRIAAISPAALATLITEDGGMMAAHRAAKLQRAANTAIDVEIDALRMLCRTDPQKARRALKKFPGVSDPGADRILMIASGYRSLGLESNGLRVLNRLGYGRIEKDWIRTWRSGSAAVADQLRTDPAWLLKAHLLLKRHGQTICKTSAPKCGDCVLLSRCPTGLSSGAH